MTAWVDFSSVISSQIYSLPVVQLSDDWKVILRFLSSICVTHYRFKWIVLQITHTCKCVIFISAQTQNKEKLSAPKYRQSMIVVLSSLLTNAWIRSYQSLHHSWQELPVWCSSVWPAKKPKALTFTENKCIMNDWTYC